MDKEDTTCPFCGEPVSRNAKACRHCGSDDSTGWSDNTYLDGIDIPDEIGYDELLENEFGVNKKKKLNWQMLIGGLLLLCFVGFMISSIIK